MVERVELLLSYARRAVPIRVFALSSLELVQGTLFFDVTGLRSESPSLLRTILDCLLYAAFLEPGGYWERSVSPPSVDCRCFE